MNVKVWRTVGFVAVLALLVGVLWTASVLAAEPMGTGPDDALTPSDEWMVVQPGQRLWFAFHYAYLPDSVCRDDCSAHCARHDDEKDCMKDCEKDCDTNQEKVEPMLVQMYTTPKTGAFFTVRTPADAQRWRATGEQVSTGCSCENKYLKSQQSWAGSFRSNGTYYIVVEGSRQAKGPISFRLAVSGHGVE
jgi:hypothetical protein